MRPLPRNRRPRPASPADALARVRRRCTVGAVLAAAVFAAAFITDLLRATPDDDMMLSGVERAAAGIAMLCGMAATFSWMLGHLNDWAEKQKADDMSWAFHLGANVADAYPPDSTVPRGPNIR